MRSLILKSRLVVLMLVIHGESALAKEALRCGLTLVRHRAYGIVKEEKVQACINNNGTALYSANCQKAACLEKYKNRHLPRLKGYSSTLGSPTFRLCRDLGGRPQVIDFKFGSQWHPLDRCLLDDKTFVDSGTLYGNYFSQR